MFVGIARYRLFLATQPHSLKEKRAVVNKVRDALKNRLQLSVAEVEAQDVWQRAVLGVACCCSDKKVAERLLDDASKLLASFPEIEVTEEEREVESW